MAGIDEVFAQRVADALVALAPPAGGAPGKVELRPLAGGSGRRSYVASLGGAEWVVRGPADGPAGILDLREEIQIAEQAAALGIAPAVVASDPDAGFLIVEYRHGAAALTQDAASRPDNIPRIAALLKRLHVLRCDVRGFDPEEFARDYVAALGGARALDARQRVLAEQFATLAREYAARYPRIVLCHNDLVASNILDDGRLWLIDFEYAVKAAPVLDLAGLAAMNDFGRYDRLQLVEAYYEHSASPFSSVELDKVVRLVRLMAYFWGLASARKAADPAPFDDVCERMQAALA